MPVVPLGILFIATVKCLSKEAFRSYSHHSVFSHGTELVHYLIQVWCAIHVCDFFILATSSSFFVLGKKLNETSEAKLM